MTKLENIMKFGGAGVMGAAGAVLGANIVKHFEGDTGSRVVTGCIVAAIFFGLTYKGIDCFIKYIQDRVHEDYHRLDNVVANHRPTAILAVSRPGLSFFAEPSRNIDPEQFFNPIDANVKMLGDIAPDTFPRDFYCAITRDIMRDPVQTGDGFSCERAALQGWFDSGHRTCPNVPTVTLCDPNTLSTNLTLQKQILFMTQKVCMEKNLIPASKFQ